ncbi:hypothetical protein FHS15_005206 [Paenibacillus castaneae]|uniref:hypothetical protein n=1 Tax=Paenibacillus castaneae TaxID=474957 RepID=UPI000C9A611C|nr:hypothetical protein [Paenibacillus castaneae]NIK80022.1 hypothetical protein [Paenibacillus castaneae]
MEPTLTADLERILRKLEKADLINVLVDRIPSSDLNSLLLKVFSEKTKSSSPNDLLKRYQENRFVHPAEVDVILLKKLEMDVLEIASKHSISPIQLSPAAPLGCASVLGSVDQNKVISALRGTEVVSDATNLLALHISELIKKNYSKNIRNQFIRFCTTHRHVRAQFFGDVPGMLPHFHLFCMVTSGVDEGSYSFEKQSLWEHIKVYQSIFKTLFGSEIEIILSERNGYKDTAGLVSRIIKHGQELSMNVSVSTGEPNKENQYYKGLQFTLKTVIGETEYSIGDGGFVDWTQNMLGSRKERLLISAIGLDRLI